MADAASSRMPAPPALERLTARHPRLVLACVLALAAAARLVRWQVTAAMFNDGPVFLAVAQAMDAGDWEMALGHPFHPLYSAAIVALHVALPDWETAAAAVSIAAGTAAVAALFAFVRRAFGPAEAAVAALLLAVHPVAIEYSGDIQSEGLYLALFLAAAVCLWTALAEGRAAHALAGGALCGAAYLTRPEGLGLALVAALLLGARALGGGLAPRRAGAALLALVVGTLAVAGPYLLWLRLDEGRWMLSGKKSMAVVTGVRERPFQGPDPLAPIPLDPWERDTDDAPPPRAPEADGPLDPLAAAPAEPRLAADLADAATDTVRTHFRALRYELLVLVAAGLVLRRRRPGLRAVFVGGVVAGYLGLLFLLAWNVGYVSGRHALPALTLTFGYVAQGLFALGAWAGGTSPARRRAVVAGLLAALVVLGLGKSLRPDRTEARAERQAAEWLRAQPVAVEALAARKRRTAWYAGAPWVKLATAAFPQGLRSLGASHLILADEDVPKYGKLRPLAPPAMRPLHRVEEEGRAATVYELLPSEPEGADGSG